MNVLNIGDTAPDFNHPIDTGDTISLADFSGKKLVLYFYPKDNTPGCTKQACAFRDEMSAFKDLGVAIVGVSKDSIKKHQNFKIKHDLNFPLISDENGALCDAYGVWKEKSMYGKTFMGIERTTFLIDENGKIAQIWRKVKVKEHIAAVKDALNT